MDYREAIRIYEEQVEQQRSQLRTLKDALEKIAADENDVLVVKTMGSKLIDVRDIARAALKEIEK